VKKEYKLYNAGKSNVSFDDIKLQVKERCKGEDIYGVSQIAL
jgi:hypothetical protein